MLQKVVVWHKATVSSGSAPQVQACRRVAEGAATNGGRVAGSRCGQRGRAAGSSTPSSAVMRPRAHRRGQARRQRRRCGRGSLWRQVCVAGTPPIAAEQQGAAAGGEARRRRQRAGTLPRAAVQRRVAAGGKARRRRQRAGTLPRAAEQQRAAAGGTARRRRQRAGMPPGAGATEGSTQGVPPRCGMGRARARLLSCLRRPLPCCLSLGVSYGWEPAGTATVNGRALGPRTAVPRPKEGMMGS